MTHGKKGGKAIPFSWSSRLSLVKFGAIWNSRQIQPMRDDFPQEKVITLPCSIPVGHKRKAKQMKYKNQNFTKSDRPQDIELINSNSIFYYFLSLFLHERI